ncbi:hypothetical protein ABIB83_009102 [Bradyrhizobium sp. I1.8.5]
MRCVCGTTFDSWNSAESFPHRAHITAAQAANRYWSKQAANLGGLIFR